MLLESIGFMLVQRRSRGIMVDSFNASGVSVRVVKSSGVSSLEMAQML